MNGVCKVSELIDIEDGRSYGQDCLVAGSSCSVSDVHPELALSRDQLVKPLSSIADHTLSGINRSDHSVTF